MRRLGKCDGCRQRKVKVLTGPTRCPTQFYCARQFRKLEITFLQCDERKPSCGGCSKGGRPCNYSFSSEHGFAVVLQDPSQMTRYGRSLVASTPYPLDDLQDRSDSSTTDSASSSAFDLAAAQEPSYPGLRWRGGFIAEDGRGMFQTLALRKPKSKKVSKQLNSYQKKRFPMQLLPLPQRTPPIPYQPSSSETALVAMFVDLLRPDSTKHQPLLVLGDWVMSIPSRIGFSPAMTTAAKFLVHSVDVHRNDTHSNKILALQIKSKALKELQLSVQATQQHATYDLVLATKMHYAAEVVDDLNSIIFN